MRIKEKITISLTTHSILIWLLVIHLTYFRLASKIRVYPFFEV